MLFVAGWNRPRGLLGHNNSNPFCVGGFRDWVPWGTLYSDNLFSLNYAIIYTLLYPLSLLLLLFTQLLITLI